MKKTFIYLIFCILIFQPVKAQVFQFNRIIKGLDLPSDNVFEIIQDNEGKMWFNTSLGVFSQMAFSLIHFLTASMLSSNPE